LLAFSTISLFFIYVIILCISLACFLNYLTFLFRFQKNDIMRQFGKQVRCVYIYIYTCYYIMHIPCLLSQLSHFSFQISKKRHHDFDILNTLKNYAVIFFFLYNCVFFSFYKVYKIKGILIYLTCHQLQDN
jgi:hypothetical protein